MDPQPIEDLVHSIVTGCFAVYNHFGYGLAESVYAGALEHELTLRGHRVAREVAVAIQYKGRQIAWQRLDMLVDERVIVELKATELLPPYSKRQLYNYLRATPYEVGILFHFGPEPRFYKLSDIKCARTSAGSEAEGPRIQRPL